VYRWVEHTSELELEIEAPTEQAVYGEALAAMAELLGEGDEGSADGSVATHDIALEASERSRLLAAFLGEIAFLAETERFAPDGLVRLSAGDRRLEATLRGRESDPPHLVKAVTLHRLAFAPAGEVWRARAVLDV
jgi:SHS2 domain-containing protein